MCRSPLDPGDGPTIAPREVMRILPLVLVACLSLAPGCVPAIAVIPPVVGATGGALLGGAQKPTGAPASRERDARIGMIVGLAMGALVSAATLYGLNHDRGGYCFCD